ncbi:MAG: NUDIX hydrolase [Leptospirales bacterium]|jgi:8-oxo-dGTP diphosphatase
MSGKPVTPLAAADAIIEIGDKIVLIERRNEPHGHAIPGGFIDLGESAEEAAVREAKEETGLDVELTDMLALYSDPRRDPRGPVVTAMFIARAPENAEPRAGDDAKRAFLVDANQPPANLAFDHATILRDYARYKLDGRKPTPRELLARRAKPLNAD